MINKHLPASNSLMTTVTRESLVKFFSNVTDDFMISVLISLFVKIYISCIGSISTEIKYAHMRIWPQFNFVDIDVDSILETAIDLIKISLRLNPKNVSNYCLLGDLCFGNSMTF